MMRIYSNTSAVSSFKDEIQFSSFTYLFIPVFIVSILGIPGTLVTIRFYSKRVRTSTTATNLILDALAFFDFLTLLCSILLASASVRLITAKWNQDDAFTILNAITRLPKHYSNLMLLFIGIERLVSVAWPHKMKQIFTKKVGVIYLIAVIIIAPLTLVPMAMEPKFILSNKTSADGVQYLYQSPQTAVNPNLYNVIYKINIFSYFILPIGGVIVCNLGLVILLVRRSRYMSSSANHGTLTPAQAREMRTTKLIMAVTALFLLCVFPLVITFPILSVNGNAIPVKNMLIIIPCSMLFENINYSINAVVYYIGNESFRKEVSDLMCRLFKKSKVNNSELVTES